ncbi:hypothetical protein K503DRAFT_282151 [Rhizopogon vinicolor AM-OR11-026]|uniref:Uncharacterized protein n=1 Tax=Rhizopogon vinicolor AM-OR11-026 TaxID=1314800 RepID=A0A1B7MVT0_9AGAM|nr:hypothetical protein K503DRAFT_282151 [Rhizopogon vinicolor AM-OR11-026]
MDCCCARYSCKITRIICGFLCWSSWSHDELDATVQLWLNLISSVYLAYLLFCVPYAFVRGFPVNLSWSYFGSTRLRLAETQYPVQAKAHSSKHNNHRN